MKTHNADNVETLANDVVDGWDMDTLIDYATTALVNYYMNNEAAFHKDCEGYYDE